MKRKQKLISIIGLLIISVFIGYYLYLLHSGEAQILINKIRGIGFMGILIGIIIQIVANIIPVPGEFISIILMEIYGPIWGGFFSWIGGLGGAIGALYLTRWVTKPFFGKMAEPFLHKIDEFAKKHRTLGLLFIRIVPLVPYHFVNYALGFLNVNIWSFIWTTGLGILPYTIAVSGIYAGARKGSLVWGALGIFLFLVLLGLSWLLKSRKRKIEVN